MSILFVVISILAVAQVHRRNPVARFIARSSMAQAAITAMSALLFTSAVVDIISHL
jgi:hypothetical protein